MKYDIKSNFTVAEAVASKSYNAGATNSVAVDHKEHPSSSFALSVGTVGSSATVDMKLQNSDNNSDWTDEVTGIGNDTAITQITAAGTASLHCVNPRARYSRVVVTVATAACVLGVTSIAGPKKVVSV